MDALIDCDVKNDELLWKLVKFKLIDEIDDLNDNSVGVLLSLCDFDDKDIGIRVIQLLVSLKWLH